jgi:hypothetical protein
MAMLLLLQPSCTQIDGTTRGDTGRFKTSHNDTSPQATSTYPQQVGVISIDLLHSPMSDFQYKAMNMVLSASFNNISVI